MVRALKDGMFSGLAGSTSSRLGPGGLVNLGVLDLRSHARPELARLVMESWALGLSKDWVGTSSGSEEITVDILLGLMERSQYRDVEGE